MHTIRSALSLSLVLVALTGCPADDGGGDIQDATPDLVSDPDATIDDTSHDPGLGDSSITPDQDTDEGAATMSVEACVDIIVKAMARRKREVIMTAKGKVGMWLKLIAPTLVDRIAIKALREKTD